jgi:TolA-binding protein
MGIMKNCSRNIFTLLLTLLLAISCAPKQVVVTEPTAQPQPLRADRQLLADAESQLEQKNFELALSTYRRYIERYPDGADVDLAMLGMGKAYTRLGSYEAARSNLTVCFPSVHRVPGQRTQKSGSSIFFTSKGDTRRSFNFLR